MNEIRSQALPIGMALFFEMETFPTRRAAPCSTLARCAKGITCNSSALSTAAYPFLLSRVRRPFCGEFRKISVAFFLQRCYNIFKCRCSSSVEHQLPKLNRRVRLPSPAPKTTSLEVVFFHAYRVRIVKHSLQLRRPEPLTPQWFNAAQFLLDFLCAFVYSKGGKLHSGVWRSC